MRAVVVREFGGPEVLKVEEVAVPQAQGKQVLIKVSAVGVNPVETYIRSGTHNIKPPLPWTPGCDVAGVVEDVGKEATKFQQVAPFLTSLKTMPIFFRKCHILNLIFAALQVGLAAVQLAKAHGMVVMGTAGSSEGMELVKKNGAAHVFNHREDGYMDKIMVVGSRGRIEIDPRLFMTKECWVIGVGRDTEKELGETVSALYAGFTQGTLNPVVGREYSLEQAPEAHKDIIETKSAMGKVVLTV
uniref:Enoyl reductase (ER) domain-containing protein n=1 Tax=Branchiostoma floridae TaxID=7739 RepID=C3YTR1_BRAFL|eukprot:XP_002600176.1 hypothetical protein BRAFLDRAFT_57182 [Branchiostoma floridae]